MSIKAAILTLKPARKIKRRDPYRDIDPNDIDPATGRPYSNYSSPSLEQPWWNER